MIEIVRIAAAKVGGLGALASHLGIRHQAFYSWKRVPAERVLDIERATGVSRHAQRPDLFGADDTDNPAGPASSQTGSGEGAAP